MRKVQRWRASGTQIKGSSSGPASAKRIAELKKQMIEAGDYLAKRQYHAALAGNISARVSGNHLLCTRHGADIGLLRPDDIVLCDLGGHCLGEGILPTSEFSLHRAAYEERQDVGAVIHSHPPTALAFAAASVPLDALMLPEMLVLLGPVALVPYATPGTEDLADRLRPFLQAHDAFLLENHGALTVGKDLPQAALRMELVEHNDRITLLVRQLGKPFVLKTEELDSLMEIRRMMKQKDDI
jgi:L-fuculose-phosphate aldolase